MPSLDQLIVWIVVGLLGGSVAGRLVAWDRKGLGLLPGLDRVSISLRDVVAAFAGSLAVLGVFWLWQRGRRP